MESQLAPKKKIFSPTKNIAFVIRYDLKVESIDKTIKKEKVKIKKRGWKKHV